jgi:anti-sigma factor RsiW
MACQQDKKIISRYLDGSLNDKDETLIKAHLERCPECREFYEQANLISSRVRALEKTLPPPYLYARIRRDIEPLNRAPGLIGWLKPILVPALAVLTFVLFGIGSALIFRGRPAQLKTAGSGADLNLQVFNDAPQSSLAQAYAQITGERK